MYTGDFIRFRYTGDRGQILSDFLDGSFKVLLISDREEIIAFRDDIVPERDFKGIEKSSIQKEMGEQKLKKLSTEELFYSKDELDKRKRESLKQGLPLSKDNNVKKDQKTIHTDEKQEITHYIPVFKETNPENSGVWLAFAQQGPDSYIIYLVNDSNYSLRFEFILNLHQQVVQSLKQTIGPQTYFPIGEFESDMLNNMPLIEFACPGMHLKEQLRLKHKKWMTMQAEVPILGIICRAQLLFSTDRMDKTQHNSPVEDIQKYTHKQMTEQAKTDLAKQHYNKFDIKRLAHFNPEIDLHAEVLLPNYKNLTPGEIFEMQKIALENFMQQAIELGVKEVFIIHGLGEGVLQKAVDEKLRNFKRLNKIKDFKNEYIQKYGFGATWVKI